jgi:hypothetical protein
MRHGAPPSPTLGVSVKKRHSTMAKRGRVGHGSPYTVGEECTSTSGACAMASSVSWMEAPSLHVALYVQSKMRYGDSTVSLLSFFFSCPYRHIRIDSSVATANAAHEPQSAWFCASVKMRHVVSTIAYCDGSATCSANATMANNKFIRGYADDGGLLYFI